jgi:hypothetical protein
MEIEASDEHVVDEMFRMDGSISSDSFFLMNSYVLSSS